MATVNKDFKIKSGLVVEGSSATVGGFNVLTKKQDDQDYICLLYTSPSPRDRQKSRMPSSA